MTETTNPALTKTPCRPTSWSAPAVDIYENEQAFLVRADIPGVEKDGMRVTLAAGELRIFGTTEGHEYRRRFAVPEGIDADAIEAGLTQGVLTVHLPKAPEQRPRQIPVTTP